MKFTREMQGSAFIRSVGVDGFVVGDQTVTGTLMLTQDGLLEHSLEKLFADLDIRDFDGLLETRPELVIVGTGSTPLFTPRELMFAFARLGVGLEVMESRAAARTFNVLAGEGRRVAGLLYLIDD